MTRKNASETAEQLIDAFWTSAIKSVVGDEGRLDEVSQSIYDHLYEPSEILCEYIDKFFDGQFSSNKIAGEFMEEISLLTFLSLKGVKRFDSYQSPSAQHDLIVTLSVDTPPGMLFLHLMSLKNSKIVIECKNQRSSISDHQFSRLCGIIQNQFHQQCELAIFFSRTNLSGAKKTKSYRSLKYALATQILFHARTGKYVIVIQGEELKALKTVGGLLRLLDAKISEIEQLTEISLPDESGKVVSQLPTHLSKHVRRVD